VCASAPDPRALSLRGGRGAQPGCRGEKRAGGVELNCKGGARRAHAAAGAAAGGSFGLSVEGEERTR
jgi:hypothetical protein